MTPREELAPDRTRASSNPGEAAELPQPLGFRVSRVARSLRLSWAESLSPLGVSPPQAAVLRSLLLHDRTGVRALARMLATDPMNVKHLADNLEARGLVASAADPADRRTRCLTLTAQGRQLAGQVGLLVDRQERWLEARLGAEGVEALSAALGTLEAVLQGGPHDAAAWDERHRHRPFSTDPDPLVLEVAAGLPAGRALDLGCGAGRNTLGLAEMGWQVTGVDFSGVALRQLRASARARRLEVATVQADILEYRPPEGSFDLCLLANIHLPPEQLAQVLETAAGCLSAQGRLLVIGHHLESRSGHGPRDEGLLLTEDRLTRLLPPQLEVERLERHQRRHGGDLVGTDDLALLLLAHRR